MLLLRPACPLLQVDPQEAFCLGQLPDTRRLLTEAAKAFVQAPQPPLTPGSPLRSPSMRRLPDGSLPSAVAAPVGVLAGPALLEVVGRTCLEAASPEIRALLQQ